MALLAELEARRSRLRPTETVVRTLGFVVDTKPDPQVAVFTPTDLGDGLPGALLLGSRGLAILFAKFFMRRRASASLLISCICEFS